MNLVVPHRKPPWSNWERSEASVDEGETLIGEGEEASFVVVVVVVDLGKEASRETDETFRIVGGGERGAGEYFDDAEGQHGMVGRARSLTDETGVAVGDHPWRRMSVDAGGVFDDDADANGFPTAVAASLRSEAARLASSRRRSFSASRI